jgi:hypothetical protein
MTSMTSLDIKKYMNGKSELFQILSGECGISGEYPNYMKITSCNDFNYVITVFSDNMCKTPLSPVLTRVISHDCFGNDKGALVKSMCLNKYTNYSNYNYQYFVDNDIKESPFYRSMTSIIQRNDIISTIVGPNPACAIPVYNRNNTMIEFISSNRPYGNLYSDKYYTFQCNTTVGMQSKMIEYSTQTNTIIQTFTLSRNGICELAPSYTSTLINDITQYRRSGYIWKCENVPFIIPVPTPIPTPIPTPKITPKTSTLNTTISSNAIKHNNIHYISIFLLIYWIICIYL